MKLGIIGMSEGNGHPYSWSAIFNGYDDAVMKTCPFPVIHDYLGKQSWPDDRISGAAVTHIWTQDDAISDHISEASHIPHIVSDYTDMLGEVDALLLARDDYQNHARFAAPFLDAGMPVYIDKPLANSVSGAEALYDLERYDGQIFTCSALRYAREFGVLDGRIQDVVKVEASVPKSWSLYGVHIIEPVISLFYPRFSGCDFQVVHHKKNGEAVSLGLQMGDILFNFESTGTTGSPIEYTFYFADGAQQTVQVSDYFYAFKKALQNFVESARHKSRNISRDETMFIMRLIETGHTGG